MSQTPYQAVREFHEATGLPVRDTPIDTDPQWTYTFEQFDTTWALRRSLHDEEFNELDTAMTQLYNGSGDLVEVADAICDLMYVIVGTAVSFGIPLDECFAEVQRSNMSKLDENGNAIKREDGKILKSDRFSPPDLRSIIYGT